MATVDLYSMTVAVYIRQLKNTLGVMDKVRPPCAYASPDFRN